MSLLGKARPGRRPRRALPSVEPLEDVCLMSATPGLAQAKAAVHQPPAQVATRHAQQQLLNQVRATLRAAGIPLCLQARMNRATLLADYQKALGGTTWQVQYRRPLRHLGPYLVEVPPAKPTTPTTPTQPKTPDTTPPVTPPVTPATVTLATPTLSVQSVATRNTVLKVQAGPGGAPFGFEVRLATLASYQAAGNHFTDHDTTIARVDTPLADGGVATIFVPGLDPGTQYIAQVVALPGSATTPAPGTDYLQSPPGELVFSTKALVQLDAPIVTPTSVGLDTAAIDVTAGASGAPAGILVRVATLDDYVAAGGQFPDVGTTETTIQGPLAAGESSTINLSGLSQGTEYVVQAIALSGSSDTPAPGVEFMQSEPSVPTVFVTEQVVQAEPPTLSLSNSGPHIVTLGLTAGAQGAPGGWVMEATTYEDFLANGWANAVEFFDVTPMAPGEVQYPAIGGLAANTQYIFRAEAEGGGNVTTSQWSNELVVTTLPLETQPPDNC